MNVSVNGEPLLEHEFSRDDGLTLNWSLIKRRIAPSENVDTDGTIKPYQVSVTFEFDVPAELPLQVPDDDNG